MTASWREVLGATALVLMAGCGGDARREPAVDTSGVSVDAGTTAPSQPTAPPTAREESDAPDSVPPPPPSGYGVVERRIPGLAKSGTAIHDSASFSAASRIAYFRFQGEGRPSVVAGYIDGPVTSCGSGEPVTVAGNAVLRLRFEPADAHRFNGEQAVATIVNRSRRFGTGPVRQMTLTCDFEAQVEWVLGLDARVPFGIDTMPNEIRVLLRP